MADQSAQAQQFIPVTPENQQRIVKLVKKLIGRRKSIWLKGLLEKLHESDLAHIWNLFDDAERSHLLNSLDHEKSAGVLSELDSQHRTDILKSKNTEWILDRLEELDPDDLVDILKELSSWEADFIIRRFDKAFSQKIKELLKYQEETAGALMTSDFFAVSQNATVETVITQFRQEATQNELEDLHFIYVVDSQNHLLGYIPLRKLILEKPQKKVKDLMKPPPVRVSPNMDQEEVAALFRKYDLISVPVVNDVDNILLGRITIDDIVDVLEEEASEDVFHMFGLHKGEKITNGVFISLRHRLPWMLINIATTSLAAIIIGFYKGLIEELVLLAMFMPMVAALGGATGNQMVAMVVRGLAVGQMHWKHVRWILFRDISAVVLGAIIVGSGIGLVAETVFHNGMFGLVVALALLLNMVFATIVGAAIPFGLKFFNMDPAYGSSILVAALTDMMGFLIFLGLASKILL